MKKFAVFLVLLTGCSAKKTVDPSFSLAYSEYPSWSVFGVAQEKGLIGTKNGVRGSLEVKYGVQIELSLVDYDASLVKYASNTVDAVCATNMDILSPCLGRPTTAIMPTSTSFGADALLAVGVDTPEQLKGVPVYGLEKSVSEYAFVRCLQKLNLNPADFKFVNMDPGAAAQAMQTGNDVKAIMVWNPFVLQTLRVRKDARRLFDSSLIPGEIIDMVVVGSGVLKRPKGEAFARCLAETFYRVNSMLLDPQIGDETYVALGAKFSNLGLDDMKTCCKQTKFFETSRSGVAVFSGKSFPDVMRTVVDFSVRHGIVKTPPIFGVDDPAARLNFETKYMLPEPRN